MRTFGQKSRSLKLKVSKPKGYFLMMLPLSQRKCKKKKQSLNVFNFRFNLWAFVFLSGFAVLLCACLSPRIRTACFWKHTFSHVNKNTWSLNVFRYHENWVTWLQFILRYAFWHCARSFHKYLWGCIKQLFFFGFSESDHGVWWGMGHEQEGCGPLVQRRPPICMSICN